MLHFLLFLLHFSRVLSRSTSEPGPKIIGGQSINITEAPYSAVLVKRSQYFCGATIISEKFVLSTASALRNWPADAFQVRVGSSFSYEGGKLYDVKRYVIHPKNDISTIDYDCGVAELKTAITFTDFVKPIPIAEAEAKEGDICRISGWGSKDTVGNKPRQLQSVNMKIIDLEKCRQEMADIVTERMVCAFTKGVGPYKGDAGDPAVVDGKLIGIASWGAPIIDVTSKPAVFSYVVNKEMRDFIMEISGV